MVGTVASFYETWTVVQALFLTTVIVVCLTIYTLQSKRDFSSMGALLFSGLILLITGGLVQVSLNLKNILQGYYLKTSFLNLDNFSIFIAFHQR